MSYKLRLYYFDVWGYYTFSALRSIRLVSTPCYNAARNILFQPRSFATLSKVSNNCALPQLKNDSLINNRQILEISKNIVVVPARTVIKFSLQKGKRKSVKAVVKRFFRLHWGGWIRTKIGRHKKLWKKSPNQKRRLKQHVFCNATQNTLLDKMVTRYWKKPRYYVDDPYAPYHTREEFPVTRRKPRDIYWVIFVIVTRIR